MSEVIDEIEQDAAERMGKSVETLKTELVKIRTGRAHSSLLDHVTVEYYGMEVPINQVANVTTGDARTLLVTPYEKGMAPKIEKAIMQSDLGLNPASQGDVVRVPMPALNEERRKELVRVVRNEAEQARVAIRNVRRDANQELKNGVKDKSITEDEQKKGEERVQKLTDQYVAQVDKLLEQKEQDLMAV